MTDQLQPPLQGNPLPTTDEAATIADHAIVDLVKDAEPIAEAAIIASAPAMATPVWKTVWTTLFEYFMNWLASILGMATGFVVMDAQKAMSLERAAKALAAITKAKQSGDPNELDKANAEADLAAAGILHYVGDIKPE